MVIKVYISGISASKEVKKRQQRALFILDSLKVPYEAIDITEPGNQGENERFRETCKRTGNDKMPLPPQFFNDDVYCGDWDDFFIASDEDTVLQFLKIQESGKAGEDQESQVMKSPVPLDECAFDEEAEQGKKSVNGHVNGHNEAGDEENESPESPVIDASEGKDAADVDEMRVEGGDKSPAVTPSLSPLPADNEELAEEQADDDGEILPHSVDEASKLGNREDDGQDVEGNEVEE